MYDIHASLLASAKASPSSRGHSSLARSIRGSDILKIAYEVRDLMERNTDLLNLTVGDFSSLEFPVPEMLTEGIKDALDEGHTNYPPSNGVRECREAVQALFRERMALDYPLESVLIACGSRPLIAGIYFTLVDRQDHVLYGTPSWNNHYYCAIVGAHAVEIETNVEARFFPSAAQIAPHLSQAKLLCLNSPQNPTGTVILASELQRIGELIVEENRKRERENRAPVYLMYDQVYWMHTFGEAKHENPVSLVPEMAPYTLFVDGISKGFASTGLRVGWCVGPADIIERMNALSTHLGTWAPRPEQIATARLLRERDAMDAYLAHTRTELLERLDLLDLAVRTLKMEDHPVDSISPQGAIYLSLKIDLRGRTTKDGKRLETDEDVRRHLLHQGGIALVPFSCFGVNQDSGWFRASVGTVSKEACATFEDRLRTALLALSN